MCTNLYVFTIYSLKKNVRFKVYPLLYTEAVRGIKQWETFNITFQHFLVSLDKKRTCNRNYNGGKLNINRLCCMTWRRRRSGSCSHLVSA